MKAVSGHSKDEELARHTDAADQERLARRAIHQLSEWEKAEPEEQKDPMATAAMDALAEWESPKSMSNPDPRLDTKSA